MSTSKNFSTEELDKFNKLADNWWDATGPFKPLHAMNPLRLNYIQDTIDFVDKKVIDVGCGGGILSEGMCRRGANVTGIDLAEQPLEAARIHANKENLSINYLHKSAEDMAAENPQAFDIVTCLEMIEHVPEPQKIIKACADLAKPGGTVVFSTINRTFKAFAFAIVAAEHILKLLPKGTHSYASFIQPYELINWAETSGLFIKDTTGVTYNPLLEKFNTTSNVSVNYMVITQKVN